MKQVEREQVREIKRVLDEGWSLKEMKHNPNAVIDAHQRINLLFEEVEKQEARA